MKKLWLTLVAVVVLSFAVLSWVGTRIYQQAPPIPERVIATDGREVFGPGQIRRGQNVWQAMGGMEVGSVWGHGSYVAPDWTADWLHREASFVLDDWAKQEGAASYAQLSAERQAALRGRLEQLYRTNTYDAATGVLRIEPVRARAIESCLDHYRRVFMEGSEAYAIPPRAVADGERMKDLAAFFFWTAWAAAANRPGHDISYTHNWPHEPLVGNRPSGESVMWTGVSIIMLLAGIGAMVWWYAASRKEAEPLQPPASDPLQSWQAT
ncbi:MAG: nitric-oxide reductase large subunit, partial [Bryobacteraceae bacterium]